MRYVYHIARTVFSFILCTWESWWWSMKGYTPLSPQFSIKTLLATWSHLDKPSGIISLSSFISFISRLRYPRWVSPLYRNWGEPTNSYLDICTYLFYLFLWSLITSDVELKISTDLASCFNKKLGSSGIVKISYELRLIVSWSPIQLSIYRTEM